MILPLENHVLAKMIPKGRAWHYLAEGSGRLTPALCGAEPGYDWWVSPSQIFNEYDKLCVPCKAARDRIIANRMASDDPTSASVLCAHCGKPSDRGFIQSCRACSGL